MSTLEAIPTNPAQIPVPSKLQALDLTLDQWKSFVMSHGFPIFCANQIMQWLCTKYEFDPTMYSNLPKTLREKLTENFEFRLPTVDSIIQATDASEKILFRGKDGSFFEAVLMPTESRVTLCISSQVGCKMACRFCQTGKMGFTRNLSRGEILGQVIVAQKRLQQNHSTRKITNVVFMGMGEPLDNFENVVETCKLLVDPNFFHLSKYKVTVSTSGLVPEIRALGKEVDVSLAISLHGATDEVRNSLMPINKKYPLAELKQALLEFPPNSRHGVTFEYIMIHGVNDSVTHAKQLVKYIHGLKAKVNLIPMNPHPGSSLVASEDTTIREFQQYLAQRSIPAPIRYSKGRDVSAACGQLAAKRKDELDLAPRKVALARQREKREDQRKQIFEI